MSGQRTDKFIGRRERAAFVRHTGQRSSLEGPQGQSCCIEPVRRCQSIGKQRCARRRSHTVGYDSNDAATSVQTPNGSTWTFEVDDLGNTLREVSPDNGTTTRGFRRRWERGLDGQRARSSIDLRVRRAEPTHERRYDGEPEENVAYGYDTCAGGVGALCSVTDAAGQRAFAFDGLGRPASQTWTTGGRSFTTAFTWTAGGRLHR